MRTIQLVGMKYGLYYCPECRVVYYNREECDCDLLPEEKEFFNKNFPEENNYAPKEGSE